MAVTRDVGRLTARFVETVKTKDAYPDGGGLYLQVGEGGKAKSWHFRYSRARFGYPGKERNMGLGPQHTISLARARELARECREMLLAGIDPLDAREAKEKERRLEEEKKKTFAWCANEWLKGMTKIEPSTWRYYQYSLRTHLLPVLGELPVRAIDVDWAFKALKPVWHMPSAARNAHTVLQMILDWAYALGLRTGDNPANLKGPLGKLLPNRKIAFACEPYTGLPHNEIGAFMATVREHRGKTPYANRPQTVTQAQQDRIRELHNAGKSLRAIAAETSLGYNVVWKIATGVARRPTTLEERSTPSYALEFLILTQVRSHQVAELKWADIKGNVWTCEKHKNRNKTQQPHIIFLSRQALEVLDTMRAGQETAGIKSEYVFVHLGVGSTRPGQRLTAKHAFLNYLRRQLGRHDFDVHGFRNTFATWAAEEGYPEADIERAQGRVVGSTMHRRYARVVRRENPILAMLQHWADYCDRTEPLDAAVIPFRNAAAK